MMLIRTVMSPLALRYLGHKNKEWFYLSIRIAHWNGMRAVVASEKVGEWSIRIGKTSASFTDIKNSGELLSEQAAKIAFPYIAGELKYTKCVEEKEDQ